MDRSDAPAPKARPSDRWGGQAAKSKANPRTHKISGTLAGLRKAHPKALSALTSNVLRERSCDFSSRTSCMCYCHDGPDPRSHAALNMQRSLTVSGICTGSSIPKSIFTSERTAICEARGHFRTWRVFRRQDSTQFNASWYCIKKPHTHFQQFN